VGAERGYNYVGGEYPLAIERFRKAVNDATALGLVGRNMLGSGKNVAFRLRTGGGAYICGEGSAMMYSIMGVRGQPRTKPPRSVEEGLWKRPTVANNTETLSNMRDIVVKGGEWFAQFGTERSKGTKLMTVQGPMKTMGLVEVPMGTNFKTLIDEVWGGMLGSGGFVVFDETVCSVDFARYLTAFNRVESCSKCVPCARGNPALVETIDRIRFGRGSQSDLAQMRRTSKHVIELSLCGLGQVAPMPLLGMMDQFPEEFQAHIDGVCPCGVCPVSAQAIVEAIAAD
jgi:NADH:ubiquinone oxidoreductase subunit F (NADH-binding)